MKDSCIAHNFSLEFGNNLNRTQARFENVFIEIIEEKVIVHYNNVEI